MTPDSTPDSPLEDSDHTSGLDAATLLDQIPGGVVLVDSETGLVLYANGVIGRLAGRPAESLIGSPFVDLFTPASVPEVDKLVDCALSTLVADPIEATAHIGSTGVHSAPISVQLTATPGQGSYAGSVVLCVRTIARQVRPEGDLADTREDALAAQSAAAGALSRSQLALEESEDARKSAEAALNYTRILVTTLQRSLVPPTLIAPSGMSVAAYYHPASLDDVGGDFYDVFPLDAHTWGFFLGDVSGKGPEAANVASLVRYTLRAASVFDRDPVRVLTNVNTVLRQSERGRYAQFCTVVYGTIYRTGSGAVIDLASGGHPPALHLRADGSAEYLHTAGGQLVGALPHPRFTTATLSLEPGDVFLLYTDGLTEALTGDGRRRFDDDGALHRFSSSHAPTTAPAIIDSLTDLLEGFGSGVQDDVALVALDIPALS